MFSPTKLTTALVMTASAIALGESAHAAPYSQVGTPTSADRAFNDAERTSRSGPDYLPQLKQDILDVIRKYVQIDPEQVTVQLDKKGEELSVLELNIMLADDKKTDTENGEESKN